MAAFAIHSFVFGSFCDRLVQFYVYLFFLDCFQWQKRHISQLKILFINMFVVYIILNRIE